ncbi:MAG: hypothetical protein ACD_22C00102G0004, partial [uncultured bacterium]
MNKFTKMILCIFLTGLFLCFSKRTFAYMCDGGDTTWFNYSTSVYGGLENLPTIKFSGNKLINEGEEPLYFLTKSHSSGASLDENVCQKDIPDS